MPRRAPLFLAVMAGPAWAACGLDAYVLTRSGSGIDGAGDGSPPSANDGAPPATGDGSPVPGDAPTVGRGDASGVFAGQTSACALSRSSGFCWGNNVQGALGSGDLQSRLVPVAIAMMHTFDALSVGESHACGLERLSGRAHCWGNNASGQLGLGDTAARTIPSLLPMLPAAQRIAAGYNHACAILTDGALWCWGDNFEGQLGDGSGASSASAPVRIGADADWQRVAGGQGHSCGIRAPGTLWCWGRNVASELGLGPAQPGQIRTPQRVGALADWVEVDVGQDASCAVRRDGTLWCWGDNAFGQLGFPSPMTATSPTQVGADAGWLRVSIDTFSACGVKTDGTLWCWGRNAEGQLGAGDLQDRAVPLQVGLGQTWTDVSVGRFFACAQRADRAVACSGANESGELALGDTMRRSTFAPVVLPGDP